MADTGLVVVVGAGIGGLAVAVALSKVRNDASSCYWLHVHEPTTYMTERGTNLRPTEGVRQFQIERDRKCACTGGHPCNGAREGGHIEGGRGVYKPCH